MKLARLVAAMWLASASAALAQDVVLDAADCEGVYGAEVAKLAALELAPRLRVIEASIAPVLTGAVRCEPPHARITVTDPARAEPLTMRIDLGAAAPAARKRLLALALAELITTSQLEHVPAAAEPAPGPQPEGEDTGSPAAALTLWLAPSFALAADPALALFGGELGAAHALGPVLLSIDAHARFGHSARASSEVALRMLSLGAFAGLILIDDRVQLSAGPGVRLGHATMSASASRSEVAAKDLSGLWLGPALMAALKLPLAATTELRLGLEGGYVAKPIVGFDENGGDRLALRGPWLSLALGLALRAL